MNIRLAEEKDIDSVIKITNTGFKYTCKNQTGHFYWLNNKIYKRGINGNF